MKWTASVRSVWRSVPPMPFACHHLHRPRSPENPKDPERPKKGRKKAGNLRNPVRLANLSNLANSANLASLVRDSVPHRRSVDSRAPRACTRRARTCRVSVPRSAIARPSSCRVDTTRTRGARCGCCWRASPFHPRVPCAAHPSSGPRRREMGTVVSTQPMRTHDAPRGGSGGPRIARPIRARPSACAVR